MSRQNDANAGKRAEKLFSEWEAKGEVQDGHLPRSKIKEFLLAMQMSGEEADNAMRPMDGQGEENGLTLEQIVALCSAAAEEEEEPPSPAGSSTSSPSKAPFKKILSKNRDYLGTGHLVYDEAVLSYIRKLEEHRKKCEIERRYNEAKAAASRLADLKTAQVGPGCHGNARGGGR